MNYLAHLLLAGPNPAHRLGGLLGDHVKGRQALQHWPPSVVDGILLHRRIDTWSDSHPAVVALRECVDPGWRRYAGIIFDVLFDCMLTRHWQQFTALDLVAVGRQADSLLIEHEAELPLSLQRFGRWARRCDLWQRLDERTLLDEIFTRVALRHGQPSPLGRGLELLDRHEREIEAAFLTLFPALRRRAGDFLAAAAARARSSAVQEADG